MTSRVRLIFRSVSEIVGTPDIGLLVLTDSAEMRQVALPCSRHVLDLFAQRINPTAMTDRMLPEVLWNVVKWQTDLRLEIHIDRLQDGKYQAILSNADTLEELPISAAEGILLSFVSRGDLPVLMEESLFMRQSTVYDSKAVGVPMPVNTITDEMLQTALDKAIENENYEMASDLRDEINRRKQDVQPSAEDDEDDGQDSEDKDE